MAFLLVAYKGCSCRRVCFSQGALGLVMLEADEAEAEWYVLQLSIQELDLSDGVCRSVVASEGLGVWGGLWIQVMGDLLLPLMADLARYVSTRPRDFPGTRPVHS